MRRPLPPRAALAAGTEAGMALARAGPDRTRFRRTWDTTSKKRQTLRCSPIGAVALRHPQAFSVAAIDVNAWPTSPLGIGCANSSY